MRARRRPKIDCLQHNVEQRRNNEIKMGIVRSPPLVYQTDANCSRQADEPSETLARNGRTDNTHV
jgi:hypothetical protein